MNVQEFRKKSETELKEELHGLLREQFNLRMQFGSGQLTQTHQLRRVRRDIARVRTVLNGKQSAGESA